MIGFTEMVLDFKRNMIFKIRYVIVYTIFDLV